MKKILIIVGGLAILILLFFVYFFNTKNVTTHTHDMSKMKSETSQINQDEIWTCAMHPQIRSSKPGNCPICGMKLIPVKKTEKKKITNPAILELSPEAVKRSEIQTALVERKAAIAEIRLLGRLEYDETKTATVSADFPGRIEKLYAKYTGIQIMKGDHLAAIFSPSLSVVQGELHITENNYKLALKSKDPQKIQSALTILNATKNKMRVWGLTQTQIQQIAESKNVAHTLDLQSPITGTLLDINFKEGQYFKDGDTLFVVSDLSQLWLVLDAYELDVPFIKYGEQVKFEVEAYPGKIFTGKIDYIDPRLDEKTRSIKVRINVDNKDNLLKVGMFAHAVIHAVLGDKGILLADSLRGKWISPMHPEIVKDRPGKCDICGMNLVSAESLGLVNDTKELKLPLVIPDSAPLITGKRAVVYVELSPGKYEGREILLGPKVENYYIVVKGLKSGERVVTHGNFKIDSELQILAKPSMMNNNQTDTMDQVY